MTLNGVFGVENQPILDAVCIMSLTQI